MKNIEKYAIDPNYNAWDFTDHGFICPECGTLHFPKSNYEGNTMLCKKCGALYAVTSKVTYKEHPHYTTLPGHSIALIELCLTKTESAVGEIFKSKGYKIPLVDGTIATGLINGRLAAKVDMKKLCRKLKRRDLLILRHTYTYQSQHNYWHDFADNNSSYVDYDGKYRRLSIAELFGKILTVAIPVGIVTAIVAIVVLNILGLILPVRGLATASVVIDVILIICGISACAYAAN
jgi:hypothetical protein